MTPDEAREGLRRLERETYVREQSRYKIPDDLAGRSAATLSPMEMDRARAALGVDRASRFSVDHAQREWEAVAENVKRREDDIERLRIQRAAEGGGGS